MRGGFPAPRKGLCTRSYLLQQRLAAMHEVHKGVVPVSALRCFYSPRSALVNYVCDNLKWKGESVRSDGPYWLLCAASRVSVDNADEAQALRACGGSQLPYTWDE